MTEVQQTPEKSELGKKSAYISSYNPNLLFPILREQQRSELGIQSDQLPFYGFDYWNHYEVSWLDKKGKPVVALAEIIYPCDSPYLIESKSMKLYFNSFNNTKIQDVAELKKTIIQDLSARIGKSVEVNIILPDQFVEEKTYRGMSGICLDALDIECNIFTVTPSLLVTEENPVEENLFSNLLKSNCLVTGQPDWGSVQIIYKGKKINHDSLLKYIVSYRNHNEFSEHCIERIFVDIKQHCKPSELTVYGRFTRRGGLDINPYRTTKKVSLNEMGSKNQRLCRQ